MRHDTLKPDEAWRSPDEFGDKHQVVGHAAPSVMDTLERLQHRAEVANPEERISGFVFSGLVQLVARSQGEAPVAELRSRGRFPKRIIPFLKYPAADLLALTRVMVVHRVAVGELLQPVVSP